jgi:Bacterial toxin 23
MKPYPTTRRFFPALLLFLVSNLLHSQSSKLAAELRFGVSVNLNNFAPIPKHTKQKFAGFRLFGTAMLTREIPNDFQLNYGVTLLFYNKSLGNNLNPLVSDIQIDFINSASIGYNLKILKNVRDSVAYVKYIRTINSAPFYNLKHDFDNAAIIGANFIINNHGRNQANGHINLTYDNFSLLYYNDGDIPFSTFSLSDGFDRFWTGGVSFFLHHKDEYNMVELSFDQFTGYSPLLYELTNLLGANVPQYTAEKEKNKNGNKKTSAAFNSSAYNLKIKFHKNFGIDAGVIGSLVDGKGRHWGVQDIIHINRGYSLHPNNDINRFYMGLTYEQPGYSF